MASISSLSSLRLMIVSGLANIPSGSLRATPILLSPMSSPKLRVLYPSRLSEILYQPHPLCPPLLVRRGGGVTFKGGLPSNLPVTNDLTESVNSILSSLQAEGLHLIYFYTCPQPEQRWLYLHHRHQPPLLPALLFLQRYNLGRPNLGSPPPEK